MVVLSHNRINRSGSAAANRLSAHQSNADGQHELRGGQHELRGGQHELREALNNGGAEDDRGFLELQACIPHLAENRRVSRLDILLEAINYIDILHSTLLLKIQRGDMSGDERRKLISSYLKNIVSESNKENY